MFLGSELFFAPSKLRVARLSTMSDPVGPRGGHAQHEQSDLVSPLLAMVLVMAGNPLCNLR